MIRLPAFMVLLSGSALGTICAVPALAQTDDPYAACAALDGDTERLTCFDRTYAQTNERRAQQEVVAQETREERFGLPARERDARRERETSPASSEVPDVAQAPDQAADADEAGITATITAASDGGRRALIVLDNGQVWREVDGSTMRNRVRDGWMVTITRHWSGAYEMRFAERGGYLRVTRVR